MGFVGLWLINGRIALPYAMLGITENEYLANYFFAVPLLLLMGLLVAAFNVGHMTFVVARCPMRSTRGGLGFATVGASTAFAAITGSSIASATVFAKIASPEMIRHGYTERLSVGMVAGSSVLGMLVPPSLLLIVYEFLAEQLVGQLFPVAMVPGLILAVAMGVMIRVCATFQSGRVLEAGVSNVGMQDTGGMSASRSAILLAPATGPIVLVLGGIYRSWFAPTEVGAVGSVGAVLCALVRKRIGAPNLLRVLVETGQTSTTVPFLILSANIFTIMLASSEFVQSVGAYIGSLGLVLWQYALVYVVLLVVLGMFPESVSIS